MQQLTCASCGAPIKIDNQFIRSVTCNFCGSAYLVKGDNTLDLTGKMASLANYPSRLRVGMRGEIRGRAFTVLGRVRYTYDEGFWDEWQITWDDGAPPDWLEEDEGYWTVFSKQRLRAAIIPYEQVRVGATMQVNQEKIFVSEKRKGQLMGSEGQFSSVLPIQGRFGYVMGSSDDTFVAINYWDDEIEISHGQELEHGELKIL